LRGGFAVVLDNSGVEASLGVPAPWSVIQSRINWQAISSEHPQVVSWEDKNYVLGGASVGDGGRILVAIPLPKSFAETQRQLSDSQHRYLELARERRQVRLTYMTILMMLTGLVLFVSMWLAWYLSKFVTRPVAALAEATQEISKGNLGYRVEVLATDELGDLVASFNRMAHDLQTSRAQVEASSRQLGAANAELEQ